MTEPIIWNDREFDSMGELYCDLRYIANELTGYVSYDDGDFAETADDYACDCCESYQEAVEVIMSLNAYEWDEPHRDIRWPAREALKDYIFENRDMIEELIKENEATK